MAERDEWRTRHDLLMEKYHALRMEGQNVPLPKATANKELDVVSQAIVKRSFGNKVLRRQYADLVNLRRSQDVSEDDIAAEILRGESDADEAIRTLGSVDMS